ncbi:MAG: SAM-dependent methyltransferase [Anaerolineales bacterium]|nr:MAG: SAM-dependent methyltransferase [Anaerolineales bacterium]
MPGLITSLLDKAFQARQPIIDDGHLSAFRLFNGFLEGCPGLSLDVYATTAVLTLHPTHPQQDLALVREAQDFLEQRLPWLKAGMLKKHGSASREEKRGQHLFGGQPDRKILENGVWYAVDLGMNQDASFYLDTRGLRRWLLLNTHGRRVLNTFAYTGSLGVAALAGGARQVVQLDLNHAFLNLARESCSLNGFPIREADLMAGDFWSQVKRLKRTGELFDCVVVDPPFYSSTPRGTLDLNTDSARLINKVRPLVAQDGWLIFINNALYVSGKKFLGTLEELCADGYMQLAELIPVPEDVCGYASTRSGSPISDPAPFNHSTKIAMLKVKRKTKTPLPEEVT